MGVGRVLIGAAVLLSLYAESWAAVLVSPSSPDAHTSTIGTMDCTRDLSMIVTGSWDKTAKIWTSSGKLRHKLSHPDWVRAVAISPNGKLVATGCDDGIIRVWDPSTGEKLTVLKGHTRAVWSVAFSPDNSHLASGSDDWTVGIWDIQEGARTATLEGHTDLVNEVTFSPDGKIIASGGADRHIHLWDTEAKKEIRVLYNHLNQVLGVAFTRDGRTLISSGADTIRKWDVATGKPIDAFPKVEAHGFYRGIRFSPDGSKFAVTADDKSVRVFSTRAEKLQHALANSHSLHASWVYNVCFGDGMLATSGDDRSIQTVNA